MCYFILWQWHSLGKDVKANLCLLSRYLMQRVVMSQAAEEIIYTLERSLQSAATGTSTTFNSWHQLDLIEWPLSVTCVPSTKEGRLFRANKWLTRSWSSCILMSDTLDYIVVLKGFITWVSPCGTKFSLLAYLVLKCRLLRVGQMYCGLSTQINPFGFRQQWLGTSGCCELGSCSRFASSHVKDCRVNPSFISATWCPA